MVLTVLPVHNYFDSHVDFVHKVVDTVDVVAIVVELPVAVAVVVVHQMDAVVVVVVMEGLPVSK